MGWPIWLESAKKEWEKIWAALMLMLMLNWGKDDTTPWKKRREWGGGELLLLLKVEWIVLNWKRLALSIFLILSSLFYSLSRSANRKLTLSPFFLSRLVELTNFALYFFMFQLCVCYCLFGDPFHPFKWWVGLYPIHLILYGPVNVVLRTFDNFVLYFLCF